MKKAWMLSLICLFTLSLSAFEIDKETGIWHGLDCGKFHRHDAPLCKEFIQFFREEKAKTIVDFGCGLGHHVKTFKKAGFDAIGLDGNPDTKDLTMGLCDVLDLTCETNLNKRFDWVLSLEVGEHIPKKFEKTYVENLVRHAEKGIILSWAPKRQRGRGHFNEQNNDYIKGLLATYGFASDEQMEQRFRDASTRYWFKNSIMVFRRA